MAKLSLLVVLVLASCLSAHAQQVKHDRIPVVPAPKSVVLDGSLQEWDLSGAVDTALDDKVRPLFSVRIALMYDTAALYVGAHFVDETPMRNRHDPRIEGGGGWAGDCLQFRICSDPGQPYPLEGAFDASYLTDLMLWYYTDTKEPVLYIAHGPQEATSEFFVGKDSGLAFRMDADKQGYTVEARIPWKRLGAPRAPQPGDRTAFLVQPLWGDATGATFSAHFADIVRSTGFAYSDFRMWGQAQFLAAGHLAAPAAPKAREERPLPLQTTLTLPDAQTTTVSAAIYDAAGVMVRTLLAGAPTQPRPQPLYGARILQRSGKSLTVAWDGCDDAGHPLPPGTYSVKVLSSRGIGQRWVASVHNPGHPPWNTDDGTGSWGGDHTPAIGAAADKDRVYLLWGFGEINPMLIACRPDGQKIWGSNAMGSLGWGCYAVAVDGKYVYVLTDGYPYAQYGKKGEARSCFPSLLRWEAATGRPVNFPFGKRELAVGEWSDSLMLPGFVYKDAAMINIDSGANRIEDSRFKRTWEKLATNDFGPQELARNALGLAVHGDIAYVAKYLENKVEAFDTTTGRSVRTWAVERPVGVAAATDGTIYAVSGKSVVRLLAGGGVEPVVRDALTSPWGLTVSKDGRLYVSDCGSAMQVKVFDAHGRFLQAIGKPGGRPWVGKYDPAGMLEPAGLAVDREGKLWVCEFDNTPIRISTWKPEGTLHKEYLGPTSYSPSASVDEEAPNLVTVHNTVFDVNYESGAVKPLCTLSRTTQGLQFRPNRFEYQFRHIDGRTYAVSMDIAGAVVFLVTQSGQGAPLAEPVAAWGMLNHLQFFGLWPEDLPAAARDAYWADRQNVMYQWHDLNGDRLIQDDEWIFTPADRTKLKVPWRSYSGNWVDEDLTFWTISERNDMVVSFGVKEWKKDVPLYAPFTETEPLLNLDEVACNRVMPDGDALYLNFGGPFDSVSPAAMEKRLKTGEKMWTYARAHHGLQAALPVAGDVTVPLLWQSIARTPEGLGLLFINGYFGQYFLLDTDGLYVGALCKDSRTGPHRGPDVILMENFNGTFFRNKQNGKYYAIGGDTDARIWEVTGVSTLRKSTAPLTIRPEDAQRREQAARGAPGGAGDQAPLRIARVAPGFNPATVAAWDLSKAVAWDAGAGRTAKVALARDEANLYALYQVADSSPMVNGGKDWSTLLKTGDTCEIMLATNPDAEAKRDRPVAGDMRLLFSVLEGQPVAVLYEAVARPGEEKAPQSFNSPWTAAVFERVVLLKSAKVQVARTEGGYVLSATVPLSDLGFSPSAGMKTRGDVGVLFSNQGGTQTAIRTYYFNHNTGITGDLPSEARLQPLDWSTLELE